MGKIKKMQKNQDMFNVIYARKQRDQNKVVKLIKGFSKFVTAKKYQLSPNQRKVQIGARVATGITITALLAAGLLVGTQPIDSAPKENNTKIESLSDENVLDATTLIEKTEETLKLIIYQENLSKMSDSEFDIKHHDKYNYDILVLEEPPTSLSGSKEKFSYTYYYDESNSEHNKKMHEDDAPEIVNLTQAYMELRKSIAKGKQPSNEELSTLNEAIKVVKRNGLTNFQLNERSHS